MKKNRIVYLGSSDFAVPALEKLNESHEVALVITQPDKKSGRGNKVRFLPVKEKALELGLEVYQPDNVSGEESLKKIADLEPDFLVVCSYGQILKPQVLELAKKDTLNIHASLLPKYRGASPIQTAILNGDDTSGVTIMKVDPGMDTGDVLLSKTVSLDDTTTAEMLHDKLAEIGAGLLLTAINDYEGLSPTSQDESQASYTKKIKKEDAKIEWGEPTKKVIRKINAFDSFPGAYSVIGDKKVKFFRPESYAVESLQEPGKILRKDTKEGLIVATLDGAVKIGQIQFPGKKRMNVADFFKGNQITENNL